MTGWADALRVAVLFAADPIGTGGLVVRAAAGPVRDRYLGHVHALLAPRPIRKMPVGIGDDRLLGGLDLAGTLRAGRPMVSRGLLAEAHGGVVQIAMAERLSAGTAARLAAAIDGGEVAAERDGVALRMAAQFGVVALDEGDEDAPPEALLDRLAFRVDLREVRWREAEEPGLTPARPPARPVPVAGEWLDALSATAAGLGVASFRAVLLASRVAAAAAAVAGRDRVTEADVTEAAQLVLAPRATALPADAPPPAPAPAEAEDDGSAGAETEESAPANEAADLVLAAARASIPADLLAQLAAGIVARGRAAGRKGETQRAGPRGRPAGARAGTPRDGARLDVLATLRAAAPLQRLRELGPGQRIAVRCADFRIVRRVQRTRTTTIFVVDASGSSALHRLAEAKGAVEALLAECYVRRDRVALLAFRARAAELVLPPTSSLTRARRSLAGLPGGGGTPLASALDAAALLADAVRRQDGRAVVVLLTDGRANVTRDGAGDRERAGTEALAAAAALRRTGLPGLLIDTSPRPAAAARALAEAMGAGYLPLPQCDAATMARAVAGIA